MGLLYEGIRRQTPYGVATISERLSVGIMRYEIPHDKMHRPPFSIDDDENSILYHVSPKRLETMHPAMRTKDGWYDVGYFGDPSFCLLFLSFPGLAESDLELEKSLAEQFYPNEYATFIQALAKDDFLKSLIDDLTLS